MVKYMPNSGGNMLWLFDLDILLQLPFLYVALFCPLTKLPDDS